ncbi:MAG: glycerol-3-phosphate acyltransferase [Bacteroidota bacterium]
MDYIEILVCTTIAYLIGSLPISLWWGKFYYGIDIREHGSGSTSTANIYQILGIRSGFFIRLMNALKGFLAARLALFAHTHYGIFSDWEYPLLMMCFGLAAIVGHIFPVYVKVKGGQGFHVSLGVLLAINPQASILFLGIAAVAYVLFRYPQLGYILSAVALPIFVLITRPGYAEGYYIPTLVFSLGIFLTLLLTHRMQLLDIVKGNAERVEPNWAQNLGRTFKI